MRTRKRALTRAEAKSAHDARVGSLPTPTVPGRCGHGVALGRGWPNNLVWAGAVGDCVCCKSPFPYITHTMSSFTFGKPGGHIEGHWRDEDICNKCGGQEYEVEDMEPVT